MLEPGAVLGHYEIVGPVGAGGMGEVYAARDTHLDRTVAVKVLPDAVARSRTARERFEREAKTLAGVSHTNILSIYDFAAEGGNYFAVTEMLDGETLRQRLQRDGALPLEEALAIATAVASGLAAAHEKHIVHRDIKPSNLFLQRGGGVKILDFGLARLEAPVREGTAGESETMAATLPETLPEPTSPGTILGTIGYMSPEQARGETVNAASDVFSFGCVLYEMLTGEAPFARPSKVEILSAILRDEPRPPSDLGCPLPAPVAAILRRCLAKDTAQRYSSAIELHRDLGALGGHGAKEERRRIAVAVATTALLAAVIAGFFGYGAVKRRANERWARQEALPEIQRLIREESYASALELTERALGFLPDDAALVALLDECSTTLRVTTEPPGARVLIKDYSDVEGEWRELGRTPIAGARLPAGVYRSRIEREDYAPREGAVRLPPGGQVVQAQVDSTAIEAPFDVTTDLSLRPLDLVLDPVGSVPEEMVAVEGGIYSAIPLTGFAILGGVELGRYLIDRHEVSNREFRDFIDAGGYENPEYWQEPFVLDGRTLSRSEAMTRFRDTSDRAGPAGWILGRPPEGEDDLPVSGVSWYEAAAYARFRGKSLPTLYHWVRAVLPSSEVTEPISPWVLPLSNVGGTGPAPVGSHAGLGIAGTYDMAGNVREWAANGRGELRTTLGGAWSDPDYFFQSAWAESAWDRLPTNGFRCVRYLDDPPSEQLLTLPELPEQNFDVEPFSDEVYATLRSVYAYDRGPLYAEVKARENRQWGVEEWIEIDTAYGERMPLRLFLPETPAPQYQVVVFQAGLDMLLSRSSLRYTPANPYLLDLVRGGRAFVWPVLAGSFDRNDGTSFRLWTTSQAGRGELIDLWRKDLRRVLDYVEEREDLDAEHVAFLGVSLGAEVMPDFLAFEPRFRTALVWSGGFWRLWPQSTVDHVVGVLHRVRQPVLMLGGRYDFVFPEATQRQFFELLGTPPEDRRLVLYDAGHWPLPRGELAKESLGWLDRWFGPVHPP